MKTRHFSPHSEGARDLRLSLAWISGLLLVGSVANVVAMWFGAGQ